MDPQRPRSAVSLEKLQFNGSKAKWQPLFRRLIARLSGLSGVEVVQRRGFLSLELSSGSAHSLAEIRVKPTGLECRLALAKAQLRSPALHPIAKRGRSAMTHFTLLKEPTHLGEDLMGWLKAARIEARTSTNRSS